MATGRKQPKHGEKMLQYNDNYIIPNSNNLI